MSENILEINNLSKYFGGLAAVSDCSLNEIGRAHV